MNPARKNKAVLLWRDFVQDPASLDVEVVDALLLRDELEAEGLPDEVDEIPMLDCALQKTRREVFKTLVENNLFPKIARMREARGALGWWWWLDRGSLADPVRLPSRRAKRPRPAREARPLAQHDEPIADVG